MRHCLDSGAKRVKTGKQSALSILAYNAGCTFVARRVYNFLVVQLGFGKMAQPSLYECQITKNSLVFGRLLFKKRM